MTRGGPRWRGDAGWRRALRLAVAPSLLLLGCGDSDSTSEASTSQPERIVSLVPGATDILVTMGLGDRIVARPETDTATSRATLPSVGFPLDPNLEVLTSLYPDLIIVSKWHETATLERAARDSRTVRVITLDRLSEIDIAVAAMGEWTGARSASDSVREHLNRVLSAVQPADHSSALRALWVVSADPSIVVAGQNTFLGDVIRAVGAENAAPEGVNDWPSLGPERLYSLDFDLLIWPDGPGMFPATQLTRRHPWRRLSSVQRGNVIEVEAGRFHTPGPTLIEELPNFARTLSEMDIR